VLSHVNLTMKVAPAGVLVWAVDMATGDPAPAVPITFHEQDHGVVGVVDTNQDGVARLRLRHNHQSIIAFSEGPFTAIADGWGRGLGPEDFGVMGGLPRREFRAYLYTDRAIYRPGQTVHLKGVIRADDDGWLRLGEVTETHIVV